MARVRLKKPLNIGIGMSTTPRDRLKDFATVVLILLLATILVWIVSGCAYQSRTRTLRPDGVAIETVKAVTVGDARIITQSGVQETRTSLFKNTILTGLIDKLKGWVLK
jgi:hypothetical protein